MLQSISQTGILWSINRRDSKQSNFFVTKNEIIDYMCQIMHLEAERGHPIQILRQDNAGENIKLVKMAKGKDWKLDFAVEYNA
jgi:hypothetical protein